MNEAYWALGRSTGLVSLGLLTMAIVLGIFARSGRTVMGLPRFAIQSIHRATSLTAAVFVAIHVGSLMLDPYAQLHLIDAIVPFQASRNTFWVGLGTTAIDLFIALTVTGLLRTRIGPRVFHGIHLSAYALWPIALLHSIGSGTDAARPWFLIAALLGAAAVATAIVWRCSPKFSDRSAERRRSLGKGQGRS
ncbi:MAG: ferric reductase-like transmembrane domain-containing protein [Microbacteriaceae bacterium]|jgi:sulfoxide reductase heme-binding subunit YedZ|nr:ferric reductase-like transmembrane domain-containing protein [Microbacteriaceae bacterium]